MAVVVVVVVVVVVMVVVVACGLKVNGQCSWGLGLGILKLALNPEFECAFAEKPELTSHSASATAAARSDGVPWGSECWARMHARSDSGAGWRGGALYARA